MTQTIEELVKKRTKWVEANRENGFEVGLNHLLTDLYPDNAHFIYELLQNAEDAQAHEVRFLLRKDHIDFEHNGDRLFSIEDVNAITSIGFSTKRDDATSIGKFGVGFKAVFAYTRNPEIHSGDFHFRIRDLVVPETIDAGNSTSEKKQTRFLIPFDHPEKPPSQAIKDIEQGLWNLGDNTLLFLNNIRLINYQFPDGSSGTLKRINRKNQHVEIQAFHPKGEETVSHWLQYQKDVDIIDEDGKTKTCRIAIAYSLQQKDKKNGHPEWEIVPLDHGQVSIYFPAEKETSNLRFHVHAPFASTVARDSVRDCEANHQLRDCIAELVVDSLTDIRDRGMLTMGFLAVLPNQADNLPPFYEPIQSAIMEAFKDKSLTPTRSRKHAPATELYRGPAKIAEVLNDEDLSLLVNSKPPLWAANPPQQNQREDRFLDSLDIKRWGWSELSSKLCYLDGDERGIIEEWVAQKDDAWLMRFYALLGEVCEYSQPVCVKDLRIIRIEVGQADKHVLPQEAFFPPDQEITPPRDIHFVKPTVYSTGRSEAQKKYALAFLDDIGVRRFDAKTIIQLKLKERYGNPPNQIPDSHYQDIEEFIAYWEEHEDAEPFSNNYKFLRGWSSDGTLGWHTPDQLCLDSPYEETGLKDLTTIHEKSVLWAGYKDKFPESQLPKFIELLRAVGIMCQLNVSKQPIWKNPQYQTIKNLKVKIKENYNCISDDYSIDKIESYIKHESIPASRLIWQALINAKSSMSKAKYKPNNSHPMEEIDSQLVYYLKTSTWIPDKFDVFRKAQDMTRDHLRTDFPYDDRNGLLTAIGFGEHAKKLTTEYQLQNYEVQKMGFESTDEAKKMAKLAKLIREKGQSVEQILKQKQPPFPSRPIANPQRRKDNLVKQLSDAPDKKYEKRERTVRTSDNDIDPVTWLRNRYTNESDQMVCQICKEEMPFRKRNGAHYFEAIEVLHKSYLSKQYADKDYLKKEQEAQFLALCPLCAAKYKEFIKNEEDMMDELKKAIVSTEDCEIPITLGDEETSIRFVETHYHDLKTIIKRGK